MQSKVGIIFGTETGNTEHVAELIQKEWGEDKIDDMRNIFDIDLSYLEEFDVLILGVPSWYDGQLQGDWESVYDDLEDIKLCDTIVAVYGLGDQQDWGDYFVDALGTLARKFEKHGAILIGEWPTEDYDFIESKGVNEEGNFYGLVIDEDWQPERSDDRVKEWVKQLKKEIENKAFMNVA